MYRASLLPYSETLNTSIITKDEKGSLKRKKTEKSHSESSDESEVDGDVRTFHIIDFGSVLCHLYVLDIPDSEYTNQP